MHRFSGAKLREARRNAGRSKEQLAVNIGRSFSTITLYERGQIHPPLTVAYRLADDLDIDLLDLLEEVSDVAS